MTAFNKKIQMGHSYMALWPKEKSLAALFPENRIIAAVEFAMKWLPVARYLHQSAPRKPRTYMFKQRELLTSEFTTNANAPVLNESLREPGLSQA